MLSKCKRTLDRHVSACSQAYRQRRRPTFLADMHATAGGADEVHVPRPRPLENLSRAEAAGKMSSSQRVHSSRDTRNSNSLKALTPTRSPFTYRPPTRPHPLAATYRPPLLCGAAHEERLVPRQPRVAVQRPHALLAERPGRRGSHGLAVRHAPRGLVPLRLIFGDVLKGVFEWDRRDLRLVFMLCCLGK